MRRSSLVKPRGRHKFLLLFSALLISACGGGGSGGEGDGNGDTDENSSDAVEPRGLNDTGITLCNDYGYSDNPYVDDTLDNDVDCAASGATQDAAGIDGDGDPVPAGQDAVYGRDALALAGGLIKVGAGDAGFDFTKLDANGDELDASAVSWACVRDNVTGLVWEVKSAASGLHNNNNTYTWYSSDDSNNGSDAGVEDGGTCSGGTGCDTEAFTEDVNAAVLCGAGDWRLPSSEELLSVAHKGKTEESDIAIDQSYFPNTRNANYWTSSVNAENSNAAWYVGFFAAGSESNGSKGQAYRVRLVRGGN